MNVIKFIIIPTFLLNSAYALDLKKINYYARMEKLQKTNYQLSRKVNNARIYCFTGKSFDLDAAPNIRKNPVPGGLAILNKFDFERGVSYRRGLDKRRKKEENHPGRMAMDLIGDMVKEEIIGAKLKTYEVIMKLACSTNYLFGSKYNMKSHITTTAEAKVARASGGNCWDYSHVTIRLAKDLGIPLERKYKGIHMFVAYRIPEYKKKKIYFAVDPLNCVYPSYCAYQFMDKNYNKIDKSSHMDFLSRPMTNEKCYINTKKRDPNRLLFYK